MAVIEADSLLEQRALARSSPGGLALLTNRQFRLPPHLRYLDERLVDFVAEIARKSEVPGVERLPGEGRIGPRLMVFMPPRHGKSMLTSRFTPAWALGSFPMMRVVVTSYSGDLPTQWGRQARELLEEHGVNLFGVEVNQASRAASEWETTEGGGMLGAGVRGGITGRGAELFVIDDPIKDQEQAMSELVRQRVWDWWLSTARPRLQPGAGVCLIMTRWHEDDLAGRLLRQDADGEGEGWEVIRYPSIAEPPIGEDGEPVEWEPSDPVDNLNRMMGDALWPEMYDREYLEKTQRVSGSFWFSAMYQQRPGPSEGAILKRDWFYADDTEAGGGPRLYEPYQPDPKGRRLQVDQTWDCAFKKGNKPGSSYVVGEVWGAAGAERYLLGMIRARLDFTQTIAAMEAMEEWTEKMGWSRPGDHRIYVEEAANGAAVISTLRKKVQGLIAVKVKDSKEARVHAVSPQIEAGNVHLPRGMIPSPPGYDPVPTSVFVEEAVTFPLAMTDDMVDAMSQYLNKAKAKTGAGTKKIRSGR